MGFTARLYQNGYKAGSEPPVIFRFAVGASRHPTHHSGCDPVALGAARRHDWVQTCLDDERNLSHVMARRDAQSW